MFNNIFSRESRSSNMTSMVDKIQGMKNSAGKVLSQLFGVQNEVRSDVNEILNTTTTQAPVKKQEIKQNSAQGSCESKETNNTSLEAFSYNFNGEKIVILSQQGSDKIYKALTLNNQPHFITGDDLNQIEFLFSHHKRRFFKRIKQTQKFQNIIRGAFKHIASNSSRNNNSQIPEQNIEIQQKLSPAERILQKKKEQNKSQAIKDKQKAESELSLQARKKQREMINKSYKTLFPLSRKLSTIEAWNSTPKKTNLTQEQKQKKMMQINSASTVYSTLLTEVKNEIYQEAQSMAPQQKYMFLKRQIKKVLNQDFGDDTQTQNQLRHLHHLVNSACDILVDKVTYKNQEKKQKWTDFYAENDSTQRAA